MYNHMVVQMPPADSQVDRIFRALGDATRRDILRRTLVEESPITNLAASYDMTFAAVQKHVAVLEEAGLVTKHPRGRERIVRANPEQISRVRFLLDQLEELWRARFSQLDDVFSEPTN